MALTVSVWLENLPDSTSEEQTKLINNFGFNQAEKMVNLGFRSGDFEYPLTTNEGPLNVLGTWQID